MKNYNPDVLSCLANLSNDEVFTPPALANQILDMLPDEIWHDSTVTFLDPVCKSGVFLREIAKRLIHGLEDEIPDLQERLNHIFTQQLYGIAITDLTSLLSRRSVYCSKTANGEYSVCTAFKEESGNIRFHEMKHTWKDGKCIYCGASQSVYDRGDDYESHAYEFIHTDDPNVIFNKMKFDVIIGNPPYQLNDGGGTGSSAIPIYQKFVEQAQRLSPKYLCMIIPARWYTGGRGLDEFRDKMLHDKCIRVLHDFPDASECFPGVQIKGGVCYFLWEKGNAGKCEIFTHQHEKIEISNRFLIEKGAKIFIRNNHAINILGKIKSESFKSFSSLISSNDPFGYDVREKNSYKRVMPQFQLTPGNNYILFYYNGWRSKGIGYISKDSVKKNRDWISKYKILIPKAWGNGNVATDWLNPIYEEKPCCCTETYLVVGPFLSSKEAHSVLSYIQTKFFHFLVSLVKITQNAMKGAYTFVPLLDFNQIWTDELLYSKYKLSQEEIHFIENTVHISE